MIDRRQLRTCQWSSFLLIINLSVAQAGIRCEEMRAAADQLKAMGTRLAANS